MQSLIGKALVASLAVAAASGSACSKKSSAAPADDNSQSAGEAVAAPAAPPVVESSRAPMPPPLPSGPVGPPSLACASFNGGAPCTPTEQRFVNKSVACYTCLVNASCLDSVTFGDKNLECDDLSGEATGGAQRGTANSALCLATVDCILSTKCAASDVALCYCGALGPGTACATGTTPGNGACAPVEAAGSNHLASDPSSAVALSLGSIQLPAGKADAIFACAKMNKCDAVCSR